MNGFTALLLYCAWTLLLMLIYAFPRVPLILTGAKKVQDFSRDSTTPEPALLTRAKHAHANCVENLPVFAAVVVVAALMQKSAIVDAVAAWVLYARIAQSGVHLLGVNFPLVMARATLFLVQIVLIFWVIWQLLPH